MHRTTILLVDDEYVTLAMMEDLLAAEGFTVVSATSAADALVAADRERPDLIILDVILPDRDGVTLLGDFKARPATQSVPVIMLSALSPSQALVTPQAAAFIHKPINPEEILAAVNRALGRS